MLLLTAADPAPPCPDASGKAPASQLRLLFPPFFSFSSLYLSSLKLSRLHVHAHRSTSAAADRAPCAKSLSPPLFSPASSGRDDAPLLLAWTALAPALVDSAVPRALHPSAREHLCCSLLEPDARRRLPPLSLPSCRWAAQAPPASCQNCRPRWIHSSSSPSFTWSRRNRAKFAAVVQVPRWQRRTRAAMAPASNERAQPRSLCVDHAPAQIRRPKRPMGEQHPPPALCACWASSISGPLCFFSVQEVFPNISESAVLQKSP